MSALHVLGLEDCALAGAAVHYYAGWFCKLQVADTALLFHGRLFRQPLPIDGAFAGIWIHGEVSDLECSEVLEKMAALGWGDTKIAESGFDYYARAGDFVPFYGNA